MDCSRANELISLAVDGMLTDEEMNKLQTHMDNCVSCREDYDLFMSIHSTLASEPAASLPDNFHSDLMSKIQVEADSRLEASSDTDVIQLTDRKPHDGIQIGIDDDAEEHSSSQSVTESGDAYEKITPIKKPLYKRFNYRQFNIAAVIVVVLVFGVIGVSNLNRMNQIVMDETATMTGSSSTSEMKTESKADMEETASEPEMMEKAMPKESVTSDSATVEKAEEVAVMNIAESDMDTAEEETADDAMTKDGTRMAEQPESEEAAVITVEFSEDVIITDTSDDVAEFTVTSDDDVENAGGSDSQMAREDGGNEFQLKSETVDLTSTGNAAEQPGRLSVLAGFVLGGIAIVGAGVFIYLRRR